MIGATWLIGRTTASFDLDDVAACLPVVECSRAEQMSVAAEVAALPDWAMLAGWLADYAVLRDQAHACLQHCYTIKETY